jgi:MFS family permease
MLYSIYSLPNMILPLFGGLLIDILGIRFCVTIFTFVLVIGQFICAVGGFYNNIWVMLAGRFIYGLGGENLTVTNVCPFFFLNNFFRRP